MSVPMKFECPKCQTTGMHEIETKICISKTPALKDDILSGSYFEWCCPGCGEHFFIDDVFLYVDDAHRFMVYLVPNFDEPFLTVPQALKTDTAFHTTDYTLRVTASFIDFTEKIRILESDLDDRVIEAIKAIYASVHSAEHNERVDNILFEGLANDGTLGFDVFLESGDFSISVPREVYERSIDDFSMLPEAQGMVFWLVDQSWLSQALKRYDNADKSADI